MIVNMSEAAGDVVLNSLCAQLDGGRIELLSSDGRVLAVLKLSSPAAKAASGGEIEFNQIAEEAAAPAQGNATTARLVGANGREVLSCDVGDADSDAVVKLNPTRITQGAPVRFNSFRLSMP